MYDPFGLPFYPLIFQILMVLTFALHIIFVNLTLGSSFFAFYFNLKKEEEFKNLSFTLKKSIPPIFSVAILLGIAPLLFIQTIYDYFWYSSNVFSGFFVILFIFVLMVAFTLFYIYYIYEKTTNWIGAIAFILISFAGIIMHVLNIQMLYSNKWIKFWHPSSFGKLNVFEVYRFLHFFFASLAIAGFLILLNSWYLKKKGLTEEIYNFRAKLGMKILFIFSILQAISGIWWLLMVPQKFKFHFKFTTIISVLLFFVFFYFIIKGMKNPLKFFYHVSISLFALILAMVINRENLRVLFLKESGFNLSSYPLNIHFPSFILFLITFLIAVLVTIFLLSVVHKAGLKKGNFEENFLNKIGNLSIIFLLLWIVFVAGMGIFIYVKNI